MDLFPVYVSAPYRSVFWSANRKHFHFAFLFSGLSAHTIDWINLRSTEPNTFNQHCLPSSIEDGHTPKGDEGGGTVERFNRLWWSIYTIYRWFGVWSGPISLSLFSQQTYLQFDFIYSGLQCPVHCCLEHRYPRRIIISSHTFNIALAGPVIHTSIVQFPTLR